MKFVTLADLAHTIRSNFHKIPHDIDFIMGIPRSGVLAASIIAEFLNAPLIDLNSFVAGANPSGGNRVRFHRGTGLAKQRVLVVDDTIFHGRSISLTFSIWSYIRKGLVWTLTFRWKTCGDIRRVFLPSSYMNGTYFTTYLHLWTSASGT